VIYDSASDIEVTAPASSVLAPTAASEEVVLAGPTPEAAPTPVAVPEEDVTAPAPTNVLVPEPVATGETIIKEAMDQPAPDQPVVTPMLKEAADAAKAAAVETVEQSVLK